MHLTNQEAARRAADRENRLEELARRTRNNRILNAVAIATVACMLALYMIPHGGL